MRADLPGNAPGSRRRHSPILRAAIFPKTPAPRTYLRAGVSYVRSQQRNSNGIPTSTFHQRVSTCTHPGKANAHLEYITREQACVYQYGNFGADGSADIDEAHRVFLETGKRMPRSASMRLKPCADPEHRAAMLPVLDLLSRRGYIPRSSALRWLRGGNKPLWIRGLDEESYPAVAAAFAEAHASVNPDFKWTPPPLDKPVEIVPGLRGHPPHSAIIQMRMILELPHDLPQQQRELILRKFCTKTFGDKIPFHAVIHKPARGNDIRNWHAHIVWSHHELSRNSTTGRWQLPPDRLQVTEFGHALTANGPRSKRRTPEGQLRSQKPEGRRQKMLDAYRTMRQNFADIANARFEAHLVHRRYDYRSYRDQGLDAHPGIHLGPTASAGHQDKRSKDAAPLEPQRTNHRAGWLNAAAAAEDAMPTEEPDEITSAVTNFMLQQAHTALEISHSHLALIERINGRLRAHDPASSPDPDTTDSAPDAPPSAEEPATPQAPFDVTPEPPTPAAALSTPPPSAPHIAPRPAPKTRPSAGEPPAPHAPSPDSLPTTTPPPLAAPTPTFHDILRPHLQSLGNSLLTDASIGHQAIPRIPGLPHDHALSACRALCTRLFVGRPSLTRWDALFRDDDDELADILDHVAGRVSRNAHAPPMVPASPDNAVLRDHIAKHLADAGDDVLVALAFPCLFPPPKIPGLQASDSDAALKALHDVHKFVKPSPPPSWPDLHTASQQCQRLLARERQYYTRRMLNAVVRGKPHPTAQPTTRRRKS